MKILLRLLVTIILFVQLSGCISTTSGSFSLASSRQPLPPPKQIALLLPLQGNLAGAGQTIRDGFLAAYYQSPKTASTPIIKEYDVTQENDIKATYQRALQEGADFIIGPLDKKDVQALSTRGSMPVPTLALNYLDFNASSPALFYQFGLSPQDEAKQAADKIWQNGQRNILMITPAGSWGSSIAASFQQQWQAKGGKIIAAVIYQQSAGLAEQIKQALQYREIKSRPAHSDGRWRRTKITGERRQDVDAVFLIASPTTAREIRPLLKFYYAGQLPVLCFYPSLSFLR